MIRIAASLRRLFCRGKPEEAEAPAAPAREDGISPEDASALDAGRLPDHVLQSVEAVRKVCRDMHAGRKFSPEIERWAERLPAPSPEEINAAWAEARRRAAPMEARLRAAWARREAEKPAGRTQRRKS